LLAAKKGLSLCWVAKDEGTTARPSLAHCDPALRRAPGHAQSKRCIAEPHTESCGTTLPAVLSQLPMSEQLLRMGHDGFLQILSHTRYYQHLVPCLGAGLAQAVQCLTTDWTTGRSGLDPRRGQRIFPLASVSRPALGLTQPPIQWVPGILSPGVKARPGRDADHSPPSSVQNE
jgi:hypothetical protein